MDPVYNFSWLTKVAHGVFRAKLACEQAHVGAQARSEAELSARA